MTVKRHSLEIWLSKARTWHQQNYSTCGSIRASTNQKEDKCQVYNSISQSMIQFKNSTEEVKYASDGFILSPRWVNICSHNFKIKFTTVAILVCVEGLGFLSTLSLGNTCSLPMQKWDHVLMRYSGRMPIRAVTKVFRILGAETPVKQNSLDGWLYFPRSAAESLIEQVYSLQHTWKDSE